MAIPINITLDGQTILDEMVACSISFDSRSYCYTVDIGLQSTIFWNLCNPDTNRGSLRLLVYMGSATYSFLLEERDTAVKVEGVAFSVWGRSKQALLSAPHSGIIIDRDKAGAGGPVTNHPWQNQTQPVAVSTFFSTILSYCPYTVTFQWNVLDYQVMEDSFSVNGQTPIEVIESLASVIGAQLVAHVDGSLTVEYFSVDSSVASSVQAYTDLDDIIALDEVAVPPSGFDCVVVYGYDSGMDCYMAAERFDVDADPTTPFPDILPGVGHIVRVYHYHESGDPVLFDFDKGACSFISSGVESITEDIQVIFGSGNTTKPDLSGITEVKGNPLDALEVRSVTYSTAYSDYSVSATPDGDYIMMFYFADESCYSIYSFTVISTVTDCCSAIRVELYDFTRDTNYYPHGWTNPIGPMTSMDTSFIYRLTTNTNSVRPIYRFWISNKGKGDQDTGIYPGDVVSFQVFRGTYPVRDAYATCGQTPTLIQAGLTLNIQEELSFDNGEASASYIIDPGTLSIAGCDISSAYTYTCNTITIPAYIDVDSEHHNLGIVSYTTTYDEWKVTIPGFGRTLGGGNILPFPGTFPFENFIVWFYFVGCPDPVSLALTISDPQAGGGPTPPPSPPPVLKDVTLIIKDWATDAVVPGAYVAVDGILTGYTDSIGTITFLNVPVGSHTLFITKTGYLDSDKDEISNETFTVQ